MDVEGLVDAAGYYDHVEWSRIVSRSQHGGNDGGPLRGKYEFAGIRCFIALASKVANLLYRE